MVPELRNCVHFWGQSGAYLAGAVAEVVLVDVVGDVDGIALVNDGTRRVGTMAGGN